MNHPASVHDISDLTVAAVETWLTRYVARLAHLDMKRIDIREPLANYGLGSLEAVRLAGDLEEHFHVQLEPTLLYDYPSIASIAAYVSGGRPSAVQANAPSEELMRRFAEVASMTDDDALGVLRSESKQHDRDE